MKQYKQYVISFNNLSVVIRPNKKNWDIMVVLKKTQEVWLKMDQVKPEQVDVVVDKLKDADKELTQVYLEMSN
jgi:regulation of enolase protein 1 (concanavalin A-like superfamily)